METNTAPYLIGPIAAGAAIGAVLPTGKMVKIYDAKSEPLIDTRSNPLGPRSNFAMAIRRNEPSLDIVSVSTAIFRRIGTNHIK